MATFVNFQLQGNTAQSENGLVTQIQATGQITGLTATDHQWVDEVFAATNLPAFGTILVLARGERLLLSEINPSLIDGETTKAMVTLVYRRRDGSSEDTGETPILRGGTALKQVQTARDRDGNPIEVEHTWADDSKAMFPDGTPKRGKTEKVGTTINVPVPMNTLQASFYKQTATPGVLTQKYGGGVNSQAWQNGDERTWMCTVAEFELIDNSTVPPIYDFRFAFEYDEETWDNDNTAFFIDPQTGQLPPIDAANLPLPNGKEVVQVQWAKAVNFNDDF